MPIERFLAAVPAEIRENWGRIPRLAYMGCHFSASGTGLSLLPKALPKGSLLLVDDRTPIQGHDPELVARQLREAVEALECQGLLLDFQRPAMEDALTMVKALTEALPCPTGVTSAYAQGLRCPVSLPPVPCHVPLSEYLTPWQGREIWLEVTTRGETITLTQKGSVTAPLTDHPRGPRFPEESLHCHYAIALSENCARFSLWRTREDLAALEREAEGYGVTQTLALWQEFRSFPGNT